MPIRIHIMLTRSLLVGNRVWYQSFLWCPKRRFRKMVYNFQEINFPNESFVQIWLNICKNFGKNIKYLIEFGLLRPGLCRTSVTNTRKTKIWTGVGIEVNVGPLWNSRGGAINVGVYLFCWGFSRASPVKLHGSLISIWCTTKLVMSVLFTQMNTFEWTFLEQFVVCDW